MCGVDSIQIIQILVYIKFALANAIIACNTEQLWLRGSYFNINVIINDLSISETSETGIFSCSCL